MMCEVLGLNHSNCTAAALSKQWALPHCWKSRETAAEASSQCGHRSAYINSHTTMISMCRSAFLCGLVACEMVRPIAVQHLISHLTFHCQPHTLPLLSSSLIRHLFYRTGSTTCRLAASVTVTASHWSHGLLTSHQLPPHRSPPSPHLSRSFMLLRICGLLGCSRSAWPMRCRAAPLWRSPPSSGV